DTRYQLGQFRQRFCIVIQRNYNRYIHNTYRKNNYLSKRTFFLMAANTNENINWVNIEISIPLSDYKNVTLPTESICSSNLAMFASIISSGAPLSSIF